MAVKSWVRCSPRPTRPTRRQFRGCWSRLPANPATAHSAASPPSSGSTPWQVCRRRSLAAKPIKKLSSRANTRLTITFTRGVRKACWLGNGAFELATGSVDVASARTTDERRNPGFDKCALERLDPLFRRRAKVDPRPRIERNQIHFAADAANQFHHFSRMGHAVIGLIEQDVLKGKALTIAEREVARGLHQHLQVPFLVDRHDGAAYRIVGRVQ